MSSKHHYFTRSKTNDSKPFDQSTNSLSPSSDINNNINRPSYMSDPTTKTEMVDQSHGKHTIEPTQTHDGLHHPINLHPPSPLVTTKQTSFLLMNKGDELLQDEVDHLKNELQTMNISSHSSQSPKDEVSRNLSNKANPTNITSQPLPTQSINQSLQYVIQIDPLQQMKDFVKPFYGNPEEDALKWIDDINHFFDVIRLPGNKDDLCFQYAPAFLKNDAYRWWTENRMLIDTWSSFQRLFFEQFNEKNEFLFEQQLNHRKQQEGEPVIKYYYDVMGLCRRSDPNMSDKQKIRKLMHGLRLSLYQEAIKDEYLTPKQFLEKIQRLENLEKLVEYRQYSTEETPLYRSIESTSFYPPIEQQNRRPSFLSNHGSPTNTSRITHSTDQFSSSNGNRHQPWNTSERINSTRYVPQPMHPNAQQQKPNFQCYYCGKGGHYARDCY